MVLVRLLLTLVFAGQLADHSPTVCMCSNFFFIDLQDGDTTGGTPEPSLSLPSHPEDAETPLGAEELAKAAAGLKALGNEKFQAGAHREAEAEYAKGLRYAAAWRRAAEGDDALVARGWI
jgi:hypothetical protein